VFIGERATFCKKVGIQVDFVRVEAYEQTNDFDYSLLFLFINTLIYSRITTRQNHLYYIFGRRRVCLCYYILNKRLAIDYPLFFSLCLCIFVITLIHTRSFISYHLFSSFHLALSACQKVIRNSRRTSAEKYPDGREKS
jgi:hypothetical protein